ncbi:hypothetical protein [Prosthecochloris sp. GSB1]|uniref:hypothetical protein n=1 Tax=Prosthecochloris sp. GSB1 TaxID=281093 RepID=UPI001C2CAFC1|nr:hypothetical protein [Prosthecochloris sp. GSB1]
MRYPDSTRNDPDNHRPAFQFFIRCSTTSASLRQGLRFLKTISTITAVTGRNPFFTVIVKGIVKGKATPGV